MTVKSQMQWRNIGRIRIWPGRKTWMICGHWSEGTLVGEYIGAGECIGVHQGEGVQIVH